MPGFEDSDPVREVLHCDKPGTGCTDAPRCFSMKLAKVTSQQCGLQASKVAAELCMKHDQQQNLVLPMTKHVDD